MEVTKRENIKQEVAKQHSIIRTNPKTYIPILEKNLKYFKGDVMYKPGEKVGLQTNEGKSAYLDCIEFLKNQKPLSELIYDDELAKAAQDHADDIGPHGVCEHEGTDGSTTDSRVERYLEWDESLSENIDFGGMTAEEVIVSLIVDDGILERGHRRNIFNPETKYIGVGICEHTEYGVCTIIDYVGSIRSYQKGSLNKPKAKDLHSVTKVDEDNQKLNKLREIINNKYNKDSSNESNLSDKFGKQLKLDGHENTNSGSHFPDDPDAPEDAVSCSIKTVTKTRGKTTEKITTKTYILKDGSQETIEIVETQS